MVRGFGVGGMSLRPIYTRHRHVYGFRSPSNHQQVQGLET